METIGHPYFQGCCLGSRKVVYTVYSWSRLPQARNSNQKAQFDDAVGDFLQAQNGKLCVVKLNPMSIRSASVVGAVSARFPGSACALTVTAIVSLVTKRVHIYYHYGSWSQKTILILALGT